MKGKGNGEARDVSRVCSLCYHPSFVARKIEREGERKGKVIEAPTHRSACGRSYLSEANGLFESDGRTPESGGGPVSSEEGVSWTAQILRDQHRQTEEMVVGVVFDQCGEMRGEI